MKLTVLGKYGPYPKANGATSGYLLTEGNTNVLLECGSGVFSRLSEQIDPALLDCVILTHLHSDHSSDLGVLRYYLQRFGKTLDVYLPSDSARCSAIEKTGGLNLHYVEDGFRFSTGKLSFSFSAMNHPVPTFGVRAENGTNVFCFTGDTNEFDGLTPFLNGADVILADAGFLERDWSDQKPHLSALRCARYAKEAGARCVLTHINPAYREESVSEEAKSVWKDCILAQERETYEIR